MCQLELEENWCELCFVKRFYDLSFLKQLIVFLCAESPLDPFQPWDILELDPDWLASRAAVGRIKTKAEGIREAARRLAFGRYYRGRQGIGICKTTQMPLKSNQRRSRRRKGWKPPGRQSEEAWWWVKVSREQRRQRGEVIQYLTTAWRHLATVMCGCLGK